MEIQGVRIPLDIWCLITQYLDIKRDRTSFWKVCKTWRKALEKAPKPYLIYDVCPDNIEWEGRLTHGSNEKLHKISFELYCSGTDFSNNVKLYRIIQGEEHCVETFRYVVYTCQYPYGPDRIYLNNSVVGHFLYVSKEFMAEIRIAWDWCNKFTFL
jgi:hypothetical protein